MSGVRRITVRTAQELIAHEAIVREAYRDSQNIWTWGVGVTSRSGHAVERYIDKPQTLARVIAIFAWLLSEKYAPDVERAFKGKNLTEAQFAAALSFHYNTGAILRASWVKSWCAGDVARARAEFMQWRKPPEIVARRQAECDLFFEGRWSATGLATVYPVRKPSYRPDFARPERVDIRAALVEALA